MVKRGLSIWCYIRYIYICLDFPLPLQVASVLAYNMQMGMMPKYVDGLSNCLFKHLEIDKDIVYVSRMLEGKKEVSMVVASGPWYYWMCTGDSSLVC